MSDIQTILEVRKGATLWFVTSPDPRGLLVTGNTREEALSKVEGALRELAQAEAERVLVNMPFKRIPQCACDPGTGDAPPECTCDAISTSSLSRGDS